MNPVAFIEMLGGAVLEAELFYDEAPNTVASFVDLCRDGFYDGLTFHRIVKDYIIQSGAPNGSCEGNEAPFFIKGEFAENGFSTKLRHLTGALSMARRRGFDTASTQFFIVCGEAGRLDGKYAVFGRLNGDESYRILQRLANLPVTSREEGNKPLEPQIIRTIRIERAESVRLPDRLPPVEPDD